MPLNDKTKPPRSRLRASTRSKSAIRPFSSFEVGMVEMGVSIAHLFSIPKAFGAVYGIVLASARPLSIDEVAERLDIGVGTAGHGLKYLQRINAIKLVRRVDCRKNRYAPEDSFERVLLGILQKNLFPQAQAAPELIASMHDHIRALDDAKQQHVLAQRLKPLEAWSSIPFRSL